MELTKFEEKVVEHILKTSAASKHAARSSLRHLERAWKLADEMPELAIFAAITAEEESATALFHSLKRHHYKGAKRLNIRSHLHKTALHPFLVAIGKGFQDFKEIYHPKLEFNSELSPDNSESLRLRLTVNQPSHKWAYPRPPLEFSLVVNDSVHNFEPELSQLASEKNASTVFEYVRKLSNRRNQVLYATPTGIPHHVGSVEQFLRYRQSVVFSHLMALLLIDPYSKQQTFVQQALNAFLSMINIMPNEYQ